MANLVWRNLTVSVRANDTEQPKTLLSNISGCAGPNDLLAILGSSGSGKTTLLDTLAGRMPSNLTRTGSILVNGHASTLSYGVAAYVKQEDMLIGTLTVKETLLYVARLRLPKVLDGVSREQRVDDVITELGLRDAADVLIGSWFAKGISGGQKRRVSIGCELLVSPSLLFLDEPTSGLDAASAYFVMKGIRALAEKGRTIVTVIHQPSSEVYELFHKMCLLSQGSTVYFGDSIRAIDMFEAAGLPCPQHRNPADHFLQCTNRDFDIIENDSFGSVEDQIAALTREYERSKFAQNINCQCQELSKVGPKYTGPPKNVHYIERTTALTSRTFLNYFKNIGVFWMRLAMYVMLCICIGTIYFDMGKTWIEVQSRAALLFFVVAFLTFMSISAFPAFIEDLQVYSREVLNGYYTTSSYVIASTLAASPFLCLISISSTLCAYFLAGLRSDGEAFAYFFLNLYVSLMVTEGLMLSIAALVPHYLMGIAGGAGIMGLYMLVCGFFQSKDELPDPVWKYPLHYISFQTYSFTGLINNEFGDTNDWDCPCTLTLEGDDFEAGQCPVNCTITGDRVIRALTVEVRDKWTDFGILVGMFIAYRVLFYVLLKSKELHQKHRQARNTQVDKTTGESSSAAQERAIEIQTVDP